MRVFKCGQRRWSRRQHEDPATSGISNFPFVRKPSARSILTVLALVWITATSTGAAAPLPLDKILLPEGFRIELYARDPNARSMTLSTAGILYVGNRSGGVYAVVDAGVD